MSCSRVSWFFAATAIRGRRRSMSRARRAPVQARGRRRSRPRPRRPRPGRRRCASCGRRSAAAARRRTPPAWSRRSARWPGAGRRAAATSARRRARARSCSPARRARRPAATASSSSATTCGKASRKKPEMRTVTSMRGRPSSSSGHDLEAGDPPRRLVPDRPAAEQRAATSAMSSPCGAHRARCPRRSRPTDARVLAGVGEVPGEQRVGQRDARRPRRCATGSPWGRRSRSCGRSAAR